jgi:hypothetical protein
MWTLRDFEILSAMTFTSNPISRAAIEPIRKALTFSMSPTARDWSELAVREFERGCRSEAEGALRNARAICDGPTAARHLRAAAEHLNAG